MFQLQTLIQQFSAVDQDGDGGPYFVGDIFISIDSLALVVRWQPVADNYMEI